MCLGAHRFPDAQAALKLIEGPYGRCGRARRGVRAARCDLGVPLCGGAFTPSTRFEFEAVRTEPRCSAQVAPN